MFFLNLNFSVILPSAIFGMLFALIALTLLLLALRLCGFRLLWRKRGAPRRERFKSSDTVTEAPIENELSEEELIVIITAAATEALGGTDTKRFRVVSFRRL